MGQVVKVYLPNGEHTWKKSDTGYNPPLLSKNEGNKSFAYSFTSNSMIRNFNLGSVDVRSGHI